MELLQNLAHEVVNSIPDEPSTNLVATTFPHVRNLYITARLGLGTCQAIENLYERQQRPQQPPDQEDNSSALLWNRLWPVVGSNLPNLARLHVEIDHTDRASWSVVNERAITSSILSLIGHRPNLQIEVVLPHLHPFYENSTRQYIEMDDIEEPYSTKPPFTITRKTRQGYHATGNTQMYAILVTKSCYDDFPLLPEYEQFDSVHLHGRSLTAAELKAIEDDERARWKRGEDIHRYVREWYTDPEDGGGSPSCPWCDGEASSDDE